MEVDLSNADAAQVIRDIVECTPGIRARDGAAFRAAIAALAAGDPARAAHQRDTLARAILEAAVKAGIARPDALVDGPTLLILCEDLATLASTPPSTAGRTDWRPIESAPRDGTWHLRLSPKFGPIACNEPAGHGCGRWGRVQVGKWSGAADWRVTDATLWAPIDLPQPADAHMYG